MSVKLNTTPAGYWSDGSDPNSPINADFLRVEIHADILDGCDSNCAGCFIPRRNKSSEIKVLYESLRDGVYSPDEVTIGPTDIFSALNFEELMSDPYLKKIYGLSSIAYTSSLDSSYEEIELKLKAIWSLYEGVDRIPDIDFKIVLDIDKYLNGELSDFDKKLELFKRGSVQFRSNYYKGIFDKVSYNELSRKIREDYNSPILIGPSFFNNSNKTGKVSDMSSAFLFDLLTQNISEDNQKLCTMFDAKFSGHGCSNFSFYDDKFFINPFIFDGIIQRDEYFRVDNLDIDIMEINLLISRDLPCDDCKWLMSCCERNIPMYLKSRGMNQCILPKTYMR